MLMCCEPDTAYGLHPIWRISDESVLAVKIDFTWSLGFRSVELGRPPDELETESQIQRDVITTKTKTSSQDSTMASEHTTQRII
ncbi:hypothetical protein Tco_0836386 [Tanacetum coccineum]